MKMVTCSNQECRLRVPLHRAVNISGKLFCQKCGDDSRELATIAFLPKERFKRGFLPQ